MMKQDFLLTYRGDAMNKQHSIDVIYSDLEAFSQVLETLFDALNEEFSEIAEAMKQLQKKIEKSADAKENQLLLLEKQRYTEILQLFQRRLLAMLSVSPINDEEYSE